MELVPDAMSLIMRLPRLVAMRRFRRRASSNNAAPITGSASNTKRGGDIQGQGEVLPEV